MTRLSGNFRVIRKRLLAGLSAIAFAAFSVGLLQAPRAQAQSPQMAPTPRASYEVASIKPQHSPDGLVRFRFTGDGLTGEGVTAKILIGLAYDLKDYQISGAPGWADSDRFTIDAKMGESTIEAINKLPPEQRMEKQRLMMQALLAERFKLKESRSTKELPVYALVVAKNGPKFSQSPPALPGSPSANGRGGFRATGDQLTMPRSSMLELADWLAGRLGRSVIDKTGLKGDYALSLHWDAESQAMAAGSPNSDQGPAPPPSDDFGLTIFAALQEQLGLKLESQNGPVEIIVIDHLEKLSEN